MSLYLLARPTVRFRQHRVSKNWRRTQPRSRSLSATPSGRQRVKPLFVLLGPIHAGTPICLAPLILRYVPRRKFASISRAGDLKDCPEDRGNLFNGDIASHNDSLAKPVARARASLSHTAKKEAPVGAGASKISARLGPGGVLPNRTIRYGVKRSRMAHK